jgi:hypothetical protein
MTSAEHGIIFAELVNLRMDCCLAVFSTKTCLMPWHAFRPIQYDDDSRIPCNGLQ